VKSFIFGASNPCYIPSGASMLRPFAKKLFSGLRGSSEERLRHIRLIACDLDGTLLNRDEMIGPETASMITAIRSIGIPFVLITRRHHQAVELYGELLRVTEPIISLDGGITRTLHAPEPIGAVAFDQAFALDIIDEAVNSAKVDCCAITADLFCSSRADVSLPSHHEDWNIETRVVEDFSAIPGPILEIIVSGSYHAVNAVFAYTESKMRTGELKLRMYESHSQGDLWYLEIRSFNATKDRALETLTRQMGIRMDEVVGIGDHYNDVDFCRRSGYVVAMENAVTQLKEIADFITLRDSNNEGINEFLEHFLKLRGVDPNDTVASPAERRKRSR
jgi:Cof subfamily protein (haloacid dehalogenase superfamily)